MKGFKLRVSEKTWTEMQFVFRRYPELEWATFFRCGWSETWPGLTVTLRDLLPPREGDLDLDVGHVKIDEKYSLRVALDLEKSNFGVGFVHSHPEGFQTLPSLVDDDMDDYYPKYFAGFCKDRPYVSIIVSRNEDGTLRFSGRAHYKGNWFIAEKLEIVGKRIQRVYAENRPPQAPPSSVLSRLDRLTVACGKNAARDLWNSTVAIVGCGGTGSPIAHALARACVGKIILIDFDVVSWSNTERVHGSYLRHLKSPSKPTKAELLRDLITEINPDIEVVIYLGSAHDQTAQQLIASADFIFGCTDSHNGRVAVADAASRFLLPALHVNVSMETKLDFVEAEIIHITQYGPTLPCGYCRDQIDGQKVMQELMSPEERNARRAQADQAKRGGMNQNAYWTDEPVIPTVGSLTMAAGGIVSNYGIGILTGRYQLPSTFIEINLLAPELGVVSLPLSQQPSCLCARNEGGAGQIESLVKMEF